MLKTLLGLFFKDVRWKLFSLGLAVLLWFIAMNVNNPTNTDTFNRYLTLINKDVLARDNVVILNAGQLEATNIAVNVRATQNDLKLLDAKSSNIVASIDLRAVDTSMVLTSDRPVRVDVDVDVDILPGYERMNRWPVSVSLELDKWVTETRNISVYAVGAVAEGMEFQSVTGGYDTVSISGAKSFVDRVQTVRAQMNVQGAEGNVERIEKLFAFDAEGNDITATVSMNIMEMRCYAVVLPFKSVKLEVKMTGMPAADHRVTDVNIDPESVNIVATEDVLAQINTLTLDGISLDNASENLIKNLDIRQALSGLSAELKRDEPGEALVTVGIERQIVEEIHFPVSDIRMFGYPAGTTVQLRGADEVVIAIRGGEAVMGGVTADRLTVQLNLAGRGQGEHTVPLTITLPRGVSLAHDPPEVDVRIAITGSDDENENGSDTDIDSGNEGGNEGGASGGSGSGAAGGNGSGGSGSGGNSGGTGSGNGGGSGSGG